MKDYLNYKDKICVVTGASSGIGLSTCEILLSLGAKVYALDINPLPLNDVTFIQADLNSKESIDNAFAKLPNRIDSFFGVAGLSGARTNYYETFTVNFIANKYITDYYLKNGMVQSGSICYVTSTAGAHWDKYSKEFEKFILASTWEEMIDLLHEQAKPDTVGIMAYPLSKRAMNYYMAKTAIELGEAGIRVNALLPGSTQTGMTKEFEVEAGGNDELISETGVAHRLATPEEMALPLVFLNSNMAGFISGFPLVVDYANNALIKLKIKKDRMDTKVGSKFLNISFVQNILKKQLEPLNNPDTDNSISNKLDNTSISEDNNTINEINNEDKEII